MRRALFVSSVVTLVLISFYLVAPAQEVEKESAAESITVAELRDHIYFLASDELAGRKTGERGYEIAAQYGAAQFRAAGLEPIIKSADGKKAFPQEVPLVKREIKEIISITVKADGKETTFPHDVFRIAALNPSSVNAEIKDIVFAGFGINEPEHGWDDLKDLDIGGKTVIVLNGAPVRDGKPVLPEDLHKQYSSIAGLQRKLIRLFERKVSALIIVADKQINALWGMLENNLGKMSFANKQSETTLPRGLVIPSIIAVKPEVAAEIFSGMPYDPTGTTGENQLQGYQTFSLEGVTLRIDVDLDEVPVMTWNVVALVPGTDAELSNQYITLGAHLDHEGMRGNKVLNGADDNASGSAAVLEIAEAVAMKPLRRPVIFVLYAAEEEGLLGSYHFAQNLPVPLQQVMVNINLDMIGRVDLNDEKLRPIYTIGSAKICPELKEILKSVNDKSYALPLDFSLDENDPQMWFLRSDHVHFHQNGVPCVFFTNTEHADYHQPTDDAEKIQYEPMQKISQLIYDLIAELGNRDEALCAGEAK
jgi:hypothetical protein